MQMLFFVDLDDTLFQTRGKCPEGDDLAAAAFRRDGAALSFTTPRQRALLAMCHTAGTVIPVTARNLDAFRRVQLGFDSLAVLDFGAVVLDAQGDLDPVWDAHVRPLTADAAEPLAQIRRAMQRRSDELRLGVNVRLIADFDMPLYVVAKHPDGNVARLEALRREALADLDRRRFFVHANDNNLSVVPAFLGKEHSVRHVLARHFGGQPVLTFGIGDSLTDAGFLGVCDFAVLPRGSQLASQVLGGTGGPDV
jgi:hydroxymethylpyrimidine pyrophosphatase-like HAD family hydrolase